MTSIRRPLALSVAAGLVSLLALALLLGRAEAKAAAKCALGAERAGCKLPVGTTYFADQKIISASGYVITQVSTAGLNVAMHAEIDCKAFDPANGNRWRVEAGYLSSQKPKIGRTYEIKDSASETDEAGVPATTRTELTIAYKSAKRAVVTFHQVIKSNGKLICDGSKTWTLKRSLAGRVALAIRPA